MTNTEELRKVVAQSGLKYGYIAKELNLTLQGFMNKANNKTEFKASEIVKLCDILHITDTGKKEDIFFNHE